MATDRTKHPRVAVPWDKDSDPLNDLHEFFQRIYGLEPSIKLDIEEYLRFEKNGEWTGEGDPPLPLSPSLQRRAKEAGALIPHTPTEEGGLVADEALVQLLKWHDADDAEYAALVHYQYLHELMCVGDSTPYLLSPKRHIEDIQKAESRVNRLASQLRTWCEESSLCDWTDNQRAGPHEMQHSLRRMIEPNNSKQVVIALLRTIRRVSDQTRHEHESWRCIYADLVIAIHEAVRDQSETIMSDQSMITIEPESTILITRKEAASRARSGTAAAHYLVNYVFQGLGWGYIRAIDHEIDGEIDYQIRGNQLSNPDPDSRPDEFHESYVSGYKQPNLFVMSPDFISNLLDGGRNPNIQTGKATYNSSALRVYQEYPIRYMYCRPTTHQRLDIRDKEKDHTEGGPILPKRRFSVSRHGLFETFHWNRVWEIGDTVLRAMDYLQDTQWTINDKFIKTITTSKRQAGKTERRRTHFEFKEQIMNLLEKFCISQYECIQCSTDERPVSYGEPCSSEEPTCSERWKLWSKYDRWIGILDSTGRLSHSPSRVSRQEPPFAFWNHWRCDWRGRLYTTPDFSPQGDDLSKAIIQFKESRALGERGIYWLRVLLCNLYAGIEIGDQKAPKGTSFDNRSSWAEIPDVEDKLREIANNPLDPSSLDQWWSPPRKKNEAFQRLAVTLEYVQCLDDYNICKNWNQVYSRQPVHLDATVNGYQHIAALFRSRSLAEKVNVIKNPNDANQKRDLYEIVAQTAHEIAEKRSNVLEEQTNLNSRKIKEFLQKVYIDNGRKLAKPIVMTAAYGAAPDQMWMTFCTHNQKKDGIFSEHEGDKNKWIAYAKRKEKEGEKFDGIPQEDEIKLKSDIRKTWHPTSTFSNELELDRYISQDNQEEVAQALIDCFVEALYKEAPEFFIYRDGAKDALGPNPKSPKQVKWSLPTGFQTTNRYPDRAVIKHEQKRRSHAKKGEYSTTAQAAGRMEKSKQEIEESEVDTQLRVDLGLYDGRDKSAEIQEAKANKETKGQADRAISKNLDNFVSRYNNSNPSNEIQWTPQRSWRDNLTDLVKLKTHKFAEPLFYWLTYNNNIKLEVTIPYSSLPDNIYVLKEEEYKPGKKSKNPKARMKSGIPPNIIHSIDGAHAAMIVDDMGKMHEKGRVELDFWAVHDSFGTHAADIDKLRETTLSTFVKLHEKLKIPPELKKAIEEWQSKNKKNMFELYEVNQSVFFLD